jgi:hypothetical protein
LALGLGLSLSEDMGVSPVALVSLAGHFRVGVAIV